MHKRHRPADALGSISFIVGVCLALLAGYPVLLLLVLASGGHPILGAWGDEQPCIEVPQTGLLIRGADGDHPLNQETVVNLNPGVTQGTPLHFNLCQASMDHLDRALLSLPVLMDVLWSIGFLLLMLRIIRTARSTGLFTNDLAHRLEVLGRYVLLGWLSTALASALMRTVAVSHIVHDLPVLPTAIAYVHWNWAIVIAGFGTITLARVMRQTVPLREEVEATV